MSLDTDSTIGIGPHGDEFAVWICEDESWYPHVFEEYRDAVAFAVGRYAQGGFAQLKDFVADPSLILPESDEVKRLKRQVARLMDVAATAPSSTRLH